MVEFSKLSMEELLDPKGYDCDCGKHHACELRIFRCGAGVIGELPGVLRQLGAVRPFVVCDKNTHAAAGARVEELLKAAGIAYKLFIIPRDRVEPDEWAVGSITMALDPDADMLLAVGSGVINDLCKVVAHATGKMHMVVGTAPSMDGYASTSSSMHVNEVKTTLYNACPIAILCDTDILCKAPMRLLWAGLGDMIAKYISICEWRIAAAVIDEYYCEEVARLVRRSVKRVVDNAGRLAQRDPAAIQAITEGLVLSGVAMAYAEVSRPASGLEHYFSHMWEMLAMQRHEPSDLHGIQVGVGTLETLKLYDWIRTLTPDREKALKSVREFDEAGWTAMVKRIFGATAPEIFHIEEKARKNDPALHARRLERILARWDDIQGFMRDELPGTDQIAALMEKAGMPMTPADLGISEADTKDAYTGSREIRDKYMSCSMLWDLGLSEEARQRV